MRDPEQRTLAASLTQRWREWAIKRAKSQSAVGTGGNKSD